MKVTVTLDRQFGTLIYLENTKRQLGNVLGCISYWNGSGRDVYEQNIAGVLGNSETQKFARETTLDEFVGEMLYTDFVTCTENYEGWSVHRIGHDYIFLQHNHEDILSVSII